MKQEDIDKILKERKPIFFFTDKARIVGVWILATKAWEQMSVVWRDDPKADWTLRSRLRVIKDEVVWGSKDEKHVIDFVIPADETEEAIIKQMLVYIAQVGLALNAPADAVVYTIILQGGAKEFGDMVKTHPAFHSLEVGGVSNQ